jgi:hypothetical protein
LTLCLRNNAETANVASCTYPMALIEAANPCVGNNCRTILGNTNPPVAVPHEAIPIANALRLSKYVDSVAMAGVKMHPLPMPKHIPWASSTCQYDVATDVQKMPTMFRATPSPKT